MSEADILSVVKKTLIQFDMLCKELENAKKISGKNSAAEIQKLRADYAKYQAEQERVRIEFEKWEAQCRELIQKNADKNKKKILKIYSKMNEEVQENTKIEKKAKETEGRLQEIMRSTYGDVPSIDDLKKRYTTTFEIIQGFRQTIPDVYNEAERETGIYFFTTPK